MSNNVKSASQHVSEVLGDLVGDLHKQLGGQMAEICRDLKDLSNKFVLLDAKMPKQPCADWGVLKQQFQAHQEWHEKQREERKDIEAQIELEKLRHKNNIKSGVLVSAVIFIAGAVLFALRHGF